MSESTTRILFESLAKLYKQSHLLLLEADRLMGEQLWESTTSKGPDEFSYSLNVPHRWYARWVARYYLPTTSAAEEEAVERIPFISIHFGSDVRTGIETEIDDPLVCAGQLVYKKPMAPKKAKQSYGHWMCKYWFIGKPHENLEGWRRTSQSRWWNENLGYVDSFVVPLYDITSSERLKKLVIDPLLEAIGGDDLGNQVES